MVKERKTRGAALAAILLTAFTVAVLLTLPGGRRSWPHSETAFMPLPSTAEAAEINPWKVAVQKVTEDRDEPTGRQADIETPQQLRHYSDTRRFLATQVAEWQEHHFETPSDYSDLARLIQSGQLVELNAVGENYVLYGVGGSADKGPFTHYVKSNGKRVPLYSERELEDERAQLAETLEKFESDIAELRKEFASADKKERARRVKLQTEVTEKEKASKTAQERKQLLDAYYADGDTRRKLFSDFQRLEGLASDFAGRRYSIDDDASRKEMKVRMLSHLRPEALKVLDEIADSYHQKFGRPLPITSLVRPDEYQHQLSKTNPNATRIDTPPHSTGLAFDISYRYMTAEEQAHVMADLARLKDEGRIEVLRENRDHYHVFAFIDGARPSEDLIRDSLGKTSASKAAKEPQEEDEDKGSKEKASKKKEVKEKVSKEKDSKEKGSKKREQRAERKESKKVVAKKDSKSAKKRR